MRLGYQVDRDWSWIDRVRVRSGPGEPLVGGTIGLSVGTGTFGLGFRFLILGFAVGST